MHYARTPTKGFDMTDTQPGLSLEQEENINEQPDSRRDIVTPRRMAGPLLTLLAVVLLAALSIGWSMVFPGTTSHDDDIAASTEESTATESADVQGGTCYEIGVYTKKHTDTDEVVEFLKTFDPDEIDATRANVGFYIMQYDEPKTSEEIQDIIIALSQNTELVKMTEAATENTQVLK